jgi:hypothetical protein
LKAGPNIAGFSLFFTAIGNFEAFHGEILSRLFSRIKAVKPTINNGGYADYEVQQY